VLSQHAQKQDTITINIHKSRAASWVKAAHTYQVAWMCPSPHCPCHCFPSQSTPKDDTRHATADEALQGTKPRTCKGSSCIGSRGREQYTSMLHGPACLRPQLHPPAHLAAGG
jgi:hypothetical protein